MEGKNSKIGCASEEDAISILEKAYFGQQVKISKLEVIYDNLGEVNSPFDCWEGKRKVEIELAVDNQILPIIIVTNSYFDCWIEAEPSLIKNIKERERDYETKLPCLQLDYTNLLNKFEMDGNEKIALNNMHGEEVSCEICGKKFEFDKEKHKYNFYYYQDNNVSLMAFCSDKCIEEVESQSNANFGKEYSEDGRVVRTINED